MIAQNNIQVTRSLLVMGFDKPTSLTRDKGKGKGSQHMRINANKFTVMKKVTTVNRLYERVANPIYFIEITQTHFPNTNPSKLMSSIAVTHLLSQMSFIYEVYDKLTTSKDLCEGTVQLIRKRTQQKNNIKTNAVYALKIYIILYKVIWLILEQNGIPKDHYTITVVFDYINFFLAHF